MHSLFIQSYVNVELAWIAFTSMSVQWELIQFKLVRKLINDLFMHGVHYLSRKYSDLTIKHKTSTHIFIANSFRSSNRAKINTKIVLSFFYVLHLAHAKRKEKQRVYIGNIKKKWQRCTSNKSWCDLFQLNNTSTRLGTWCTALIKSGAHDAKIGCDLHLNQPFTVYINRDIWRLLNF